MEITRVPTEFISTPNPLLSEGIAEWTLSAMSRRLVWGDDYTSVGRQMMPALPLSERGLGTGDTTIEAEIGYTKPIGFEEAKRCLQCQLNIFIDGNRCILCANCVDVCPDQMHRDDLARPHSLDRRRRRAGRDGPGRAGSAGGGDGDRRATLHPLRALRRLVPDRVPDDGPLPPHAGPERESVDLAVVAD